MHIYIHRGDQQSGPFSPEEIRSQLASGALLPSDLAWYEGAAAWMPVSSIPGISAGAQPPQFVRQQMPVYQPQQKRTSGLAIASLVLGLLGFILSFLTGIPAVICGHMALSRIKQEGDTLSGKGLAITGLVTGYLSIFLVFVVAILASLALPVFTQVQQRALQIQSLSNAKQVYLACKLYANDNDGKFPEKLEQLLPNYLNDRKVLSDPLDKTGSSSYEYFGGKDTDPPDKILLQSKVVKNHKRVVVQVDGVGRLQSE